MNASPVVLVIGFMLDYTFGDPLWLPHPVVGMGKLIAFLEKLLRHPAKEKSPAAEIAAGALLVGCVLALTLAVTYGVLYLAGMVHPWLQAALATFLLYQTLACKCLADAAEAVYQCLARNDLAGAREAVGRIVGRDTANLPPGEIARATIETVAENASDGVIAPLFYYALGGVPLAMLYKAVNTMDSMLGYRNDRYLYFGRVAARLDDVANFIPARLTGLCLIFATLFCGLNFHGAARVFWRDRKKHPSPNSAHPEAACAGALGIRLGGDSAYGGRVSHKPHLGDANREIEAEDIKRTQKLLFASAWIFLWLLWIFLMCYLGP